LSVFKFGEIRVDVHRTGPDPLSPNIDFYTVRISHDHVFIESLIKKPKGHRTAGSDFSIAVELIESMFVTAMNPEVWAREAQAEGSMSQEEIDAVTQVASSLAPYMKDAVENLEGRSEIYQEHYEGTDGPLELGISRKLELPDRIRTKEEMAEFFAYLYLVDRTSFHPDDSFEDYVDRKGNQAFTAEEAALRDDLMAQARGFSYKQKMDIYEMALWVGALVGANEDPENEATAPAGLKSLSNAWV
jgi:hypothetical protein